MRPVRPPAGGKLTGKARRDDPRAAGLPAYAAARGRPGARVYHGRMVRKLLLASPRGYCAGVERAVDTVEQALELYGPPVYVRKQIVHNLHVVRDLEERGAIFVDQVSEVPEGETVVFSLGAHRHPRDWRSWNLARARAAGVHDDLERAR